MNTLKLAIASGAIAGVSTVATILAIPTVVRTVDKLWMPINARSIVVHAAMNTNQED